MFGNQLVWIGFVKERYLKKPNLILVQHVVPEKKHQGVMATHITP
jgi:hypothetical protein